MKISISNKIKEQAPSIQLDELEAFQVNYMERFYSSVESKIEGKDFARNSLMFLFSIQQRSFGLFKGAINSLNNLDMISSYLAARAHMESTGSIAYFLIQLRKYYKKEITMQQLDDCLLQLSFGKKYYDPDSKTSVKFQPINVLTLIDAVDNVFFKSAGEKKYKKIFRDTYEWLSEFCHPNHYGQIIGVDQSGRKAVFNHQHFPEGSEIQHFYFSLHSSCHLYFPMYDICFSLIEQNEKMPELVKYVTEKS